MVIVYSTMAIGYSEQNIAFLCEFGQVLRAINLTFVVGGDFKLAGEVLEQSGWLHALRARIGAPSNNTHTCLDSKGKRRGMDFFVVSEALHPFVKHVPVDDNSMVIHTHRPVALTLEEVTSGRLVRRHCRHARPLRTVPVGPSRKPPRATAPNSTCWEGAAANGGGAAHIPGGGGLVVEADGGV